MKHADKRLAFLVLVLSVATLGSALAQASPDNIPAALEQIKTDTVQLFPMIENIAAVVMAIMGVIAGVNVFNKWSNGDHHARQSALAWFSAVIFASFMLLFVKAIFKTT